MENGQALFNANCASCHLVTADVLAAPGLAGIADRWGASDELLVQWIQNPQVQQPRETDTSSLWWTVTSERMDG